MIKIKDNGTYTLHVSPTTPVEVTQGFIRPYFGEKGIIGYEIQFTEFGEPIIVEPAVEASEGVEAKEAVIYIPEIKWGFYRYGEFTCNHEDSAILLKCHQKAIERLGDEWEIFNLNTVV